jgi:N-methylhydantoinase B
MQLWTDSGGPGKWRGGLGFYSEVEWLRGKATASLRRDRHKFRPWGLAGGYSGPECKTALKKKNTVKGKIIPGKSQIELNEGDILQLCTTGSGGHSDPLERDEKLVLDDYLNNKISFSAVKDIYGVVIEANKVNLNKTKRLRQKLVG